MKKETVYIVGVPKGKKCHKEILCNDITEIFNKMLKVYPDKDMIATIIGDHESYKDFRPLQVFVGYKQQEAVDEFIKTYGKKTNLNVVR